MLIKQTIKVEASGKTRDEAFQRLRLSAQEQIGAMPSVSEVRRVGREDNFIEDGTVSISVRFAVWRDVSVVEAIDRALSGEQE